MKINCFKDCEVWQLAKELLPEIYSITDKFPREEKFIFVSQMKRAALSITSNVAEGWGRFHYLSKINFFYIARGSIEELKSQTIIAKNLNYIDKVAFEDLMKKINKIGVKLNNLINRTRKMHSPK